MGSNKAKRKRQSRLAFTPLPSSSPASRVYHQQIQDRAAAVRLDVSPSPVKRRKLQHSPEALISFDGAGDLPPIPTPAASLERSEEERRAAAGVGSEDDSDPIRGTQRQTQPKRKALQRQQQQLDFTNAQEPSSFGSPVRLTSSRRQPSNHTMFSSPNRRRNATINNQDSGASSPEELPSPRELMAKRAKKANPPSSRPRRSSQRPVTVDSDSDDIVISVRRKTTPQASQEDDDEDDMPTTHGKQSRKRRRQASPDSFISDSPPAAEDSDDDVVVIAGSAKNRRGQREDSDEEEEEDQEPKTPKQRRQRQLSQREQADLAEDLDFLAPSEDEAGRKPRSTQSAQKTARAKALEKLKRSRSGNVALVTISDDEESGGPSEDESMDDANDDELDDDEVDEVRPPTSSRQMFREDENDAGFLDEDEEAEGPLGIPDGLPIEFTRFATMKPKELFKYAVEWFVQRKINPAYQADDEIYKLTFKKLDDEVRGLAGSKFTSAAWTSVFTLALQARPEIAWDSIDRTSDEHLARDKCDACNRSSHPATYQIQFQGKPYHRETLEEIAQLDDDSDEDDTDDESDSADADDEPVRDAQGREIAALSTMFYVGKFCFANAKTAHALNHWRYHLNEWVQGWLIGQGYCDAARVVERDAWSTKKRRKNANKIVDRMEQEGVVKKLYRQFTENSDDARNSKQGRFVGDGG